MSNRYQNDRQRSTEQQPANRNIQGNNENQNCKKRIKVYNTFRGLWEQHGFWTRSVIISAAHKLPDLKYATQRLLRNPDDFALALDQFYPKEQANTFGKLLKDHLVIASRIIENAKAGNTRGVATERKLWYENAEEIARHLSKMNPNWNEKEWTSMMFDHLRMVENEAILRLTGRYADDIAQFDRLEEQALHMADEMAEGIIKQFNI